MGVDLVKIGVITGPHGVHGQVRVFPLTDFPERFTTLRRVLLGPDARPTDVRYMGTVKNVILLTVDGISDRDQAEKLRSHYLQVPRSEAYPLPEGHHYIFDLIGLAIVDTNGAPIGRLADVDTGNPVHDLYVVEVASHKQFLVPVVKEFVKSIDLEKGQIVIAPIPGLLED